MIEVRLLTTENMSNTFKRVLVLILLGLLTNTVSAQFRTNVPTTRIKDAVARNQGSSLSSLLSSDRLSMHHSFSLGMASMGGFAASYGTYTNNLNYLINDKWSLTSRIDLVQPTSSPYPQGVNGVSPMLFYGAELNYKASENLSFSISMDNHPRYHRNWGLSPYGYSRFPAR